MQEIKSERQEQSQMALIELMTKSEIESNESSLATTFLKSTLRSLFSSSLPATGRESDNDSKLKHISLDEVLYHDSSDDCWIIIYDRVYDVTDFLRQVSSVLRLHPVHGMTCGRTDYVH